MDSSMQNGELTAEDTPIIALLTERPLMDRFDNILGEWHELFMKKHKGYGPSAADELGLAGQWADLSRKIRHLGAWAWDGGPPPAVESPREILMDLIGHAFLAIDMIDRDVPRLGVRGERS